MTYVDQYYQDPLGQVHFLSAQQQADAAAQGLGLPMTNWTAITPQQAAVINSPSPEVLLSVYRQSAKSALDDTSATMERIMEGVAGGTCAFTNADVVTFMSYRKQLRALLQATSVGTLPTRPAYPAGT